MKTHATFKNRILFSLALGFLLISFHANSQANFWLNNLMAPVAVNLDLTPQGDNLKNIGSIASSWKNIYLDGTLYIDGSKFLDNAGAYNTFIGATGNTTNSGTRITAVGSGALFYNSTGSYNTATGRAAMYFNSVGSQNTANGYAALYSNKADSNTALGAQALFKNTSGKANAASGACALYSNDWGYHNTATGSSALFTNDYGNDNTATGYRALFHNTWGPENTAVGSQALYSNINNDGSTAVGYQTLYANTGFRNTAIGDEALFKNTIGYDNTVAGYHAMWNNTTGSKNTAIGYLAFDGNDQGSYNTAIGYGSGDGPVPFTNNSNCTFLGYSSGTSVTTDLNNSTALGNACEVDGDNQVRIGNDAVSSIGGWTDWTNISDARVKKNIKLNVPGLAFINMLKPVSYNYDLEAAHKIIWSNGTKDKNEKSDLVMSGNEAASLIAKEEITYSGFLAQDVEEAAKKLVMTLVVWMYLKMKMACMVCAMHSL